MGLDASTVGLVAAIPSSDADPAGLDAVPSEPAPLIPPFPLSAFPASHPEQTAQPALQAFGAAAPFQPFYSASNRQRVRGR